MDNVNRNKPPIKQKIQVWDTRMGLGKTTGMINFIKEHPENKYIFATIYDTEVKRILNELPNFREPSKAIGKGRKRNHFIQLVGC